MSASLVGSEMCIRDSPPPRKHASARRHEYTALRATQSYRSAIGTHQLRREIGQEVIHCNALHLHTRRRKTHAVCAADTHALHELSYPRWPVTTRNYIELADPPSMCRFSKPRAQVAPPMERMWTNKPSMSLVSRPQDIDSSESREGRCMGLDLDMDMDLGLRLGLRLRPGLRLRCMCVLVCDRDCI
eukprot:13315757-Alexandrium_andersonii.AAC.1